MKIERLEIPLIDSCVRLIICYMIEYAEDGESGRSYISKNIIQDILERNKENG